MNQTIVRLQPAIMVKLKPFRSRSYPPIPDSYVGVEGALSGDSEQLIFQPEGLPGLRVGPEQLLLPGSPSLVYNFWRILGFQKQTAKDWRLIDNPPDIRLESIEDGLSVLQRPPDAYYRPYYRIDDSQEDIDKLVSDLWRADIGHALGTVKNFQGELWVLKGELVLMWDPVAFRRQIDAELATRRQEDLKYFRHRGPLGQAFYAWHNFMGTKRRIYDRFRFNQNHAFLVRAFKGTRKILEQQLRPLVDALPHEARPAIRHWLDHRNEEEINCDSGLHTQIYERYHSART